MPTDAIGQPLRIGPVRLASNLLLAPIAGWCDLAWRMTVREIGPVLGKGLDPADGAPTPVPGVGLASTDLLSPLGLICGSEASADLARTNDADQPIGMQLYGADPHVLAEGARWCADHGATVVDINMGCPVDKVTKRNGGSKLMCDVPGAVGIAAAVRRALPDHIPLTAKMRLGWDEEAFRRNTAGLLATRLADEGVAAITVHGRTTEQMFGGRARLEGIRAVVEAVAAHTGPYRADGGPGIPVVGNGDVRSVGDALRMLGETGCAGVMIGRGAFAMPWLFRDAWAAQLDARDAPGRPLVAPFPEPDRLEVVRRYFARLLEFRGERPALHRIRQKISWLGRHINGSHCAELKRRIREAKSPADVFTALDDWGVMTVDAAAPPMHAAPVGA